MKNNNYNLFYKFMNMKMNMFKFKVLNVDAYK